MSKTALMSRAEELRRARVPFVFATVVRTERPTSAKPGDCAVILPDGSIEGFVGGSCAESSVRAESLRVLQSRESTLLMISPEAHPEETPSGMVIRSNPCLSGGSLEMFLEPSIPDPLVHVYGHGPIANALVQLGNSVRFDVRLCEISDSLPSDLFAVVIATYGSNENLLLQMALSDGIPYVGLVASAKRGRLVLDSLGPIDGLERVHTPAGLEIGASEAGEIAVSIFAEMILVRSKESNNLSQNSFDEGPQTAFGIDVVCSMEVAKAESSLHFDFMGLRYWFCGSGCLEAFKFDPERYIKA